jgi:hypothetical protein
MIKYIYIFFFFQLVNNFELLTSVARLAGWTPPPPLVQDILTKTIVILII